MEQYFAVNQRFWQGSWFQYIFYASVVLILVFEKRITHKIIFGIFPTLMLVGMFNPLTSALVGLFFRSADVYYVRLFSIIPIFYCIAHGLVLVLGRLRGALKLACVCAVAAGIILAGHSVYRESWMKRAENLEKVPNDAIRVVAGIPRDRENVRVAFPDPLYYYARQIDAGIVMPYGRQIRGNTNALLQELNKDNPDPAAVMTEAGKQYVDYVVVKRSEEVVTSFRESGRLPVFETAKYCIYPVTKAERRVAELNDKRQMMSTTVLNAKGDPAYSYSTVVTRTVYERDRWGNNTKTEYYDRDGNRVTVADGYAGTRKQFKLVGLNWVVDSLACLDALDRPVLVQGRYATRYEYNQHRQVVRESYYDISGKPMRRLDTGYAAVLKSYDKSGRLVSERYVDEDGRPMQCYAGYARHVRWYDEKGRCIAEQCFDVNGRAVNNADGYAGYTRSYDKKGNITGETYFDENMKALDIDSLVARNGTLNLLERLEKPSADNAVGIRYSWNDDGSCHVSGKSEGISWYSILQGDRPYFLKPGGRYHIRYASEDVLLRISFYRDSSWTNPIKSMTVRENSQFTVPRNCRAMIMRLWVAPGKEIDETVYPQILERKR